MTLSPDALATLGPLADAADEVAADLVSRQAVRRTFEADHTLWRDDPTEVADRLGWIPVVAEVQAALPELRDRCSALVTSDRVDHVLVMGMGGSSLFPEVLARTFGPRDGHPQLHVLDSTDPSAVARVAAACPPDHTLHVASSKSGSTIETRSHLEWAWERSGDPARFAVVTDPGSELGDLARERGFAEVFENRPDIGGRYSALSLFGIVPALLAGVDVEALLGGARDALADCGPDADPATNPALALAAALAAGVAAGHDKATFVLDPAVDTFGLWLEQLVAESLGKDGTGVVPIVGEPLGLGEYGDDRLFVVGCRRSEALDDAAEGVPGTVAGTAARLLAAGHPCAWLPVDAEARSLGHAVVVAELATAWTGAALGVQPFDQPDVAAAKAATNEVLAQGGVDVPEVCLDALLDQLHPGDHLAVQAFVDPESPIAAELQAVRTRLRDEHRVAVSLGFGPRFLHSTGQLHKGGPRSIVCIQVSPPDQEEIPIPGRDFGFGHLKQAQAAGDLRALQDRGIRAGRVSLDALLAR
ncbi:MAG: glucose-6-phosphate isomerase [Acidimicrobiia bacterium]